MIAELVHSDRLDPFTNQEKIVGERVQKVIANAGLGSRREVEGWIRDGRVLINGQKAKLGDQVAENEVVTANGKRYRTVSGGNRRRVVIYNKPEGEICTRKDPQGRPTVYKALPRMQRGRWISVGRLDINTSGLLLFTNDGELANQMMHPSSEIEREYAVRLRGEVLPETRDRLLAGVELEDGVARFESIRYMGGEGHNRWYHVVIKEGKNREVRRMWTSQGVEISRLTRVRYGNAHLPRDLKIGKMRELEPKEINRLAKFVGVLGVDESEYSSGIKLVVEKSRTYKKGRSRR